MSKTIKLLKSIIVILSEAQTFYPLTKTVYKHPLLRTHAHRHLYKLTRDVTYTPKISKSIAVNCFIETFNQICVQHPWLEQNLLNHPEIALWSKKFEADAIHIVLRVAHIDFSHEGELELSFRLNGAPLFNLAFILTNINQPAALVTRMQGVYGAYPEIKKACKHLHDLNISYTLLSSLEAFCQTLNIGQIHGLQYKDQYSYHVEKKTNESFKSTYDAFWLKRNAYLNEDVYVTPLPTHTADYQPHGKHKSRSIKHANIHHEILEQVITHLTALKQNASPRPNTTP